MPDPLPFPAPPERPTTADLIRLASDLATWLQSMDDGEEDHVGEVMEAWVEEYFSGSEAKIDALYFVQKRMEAEERLVRTEVERLQSRAQRLARSRERVLGLTRGLLEANLGLTGENHIAASSVTATLAKSPPKLELDEFELSMDYYRNNPKPDKPRIKQLLKQGKTVPGAKLVSGFHVRFR
jgi:hypothetical protein